MTSSPHGLGDLHTPPGKPRKWWGIRSRRCGPQGSNRQSNRLRFPSRQINDKPRPGRTNPPTRPSFFLWTSDLADILGT